MDLTPHIRQKRVAEISPNHLHAEPTKKRRCSRHCADQSKSRRGGVAEIYTSNGSFQAPSLHPSSSSEVTAAPDDAKSRSSVRSGSRSSLWKQRASHHPTFTQRPHSIGPDIESSRTASLVEPQQHSEHITCCTLQLDIAARAGGTHAPAKHPQKLKKPTTKARLVTPSHSLRQDRHNASSCPDILSQHNIEWLQEWVRDEAVNMNPDCFHVEPRKMAQYNDNPRDCKPLSGCFDHTTCNDLENHAQDQSSALMGTLVARDDLKTPDMSFAGDKRIEDWLDDPDSNDENYYGNDYPEREPSGMWEREEDDANVWSGSDEPSISFILITTGEQNNDFGGPASHFV